MWLERLGVLLVILGLTSATSYWLGSESVQKKWDQEKAVQAALLKAEKDSAIATVASLTENHKKELENAKSEAGRAAVRDWLKRHGMLPDGSPMRSSGSKVSADRTKVPDATSEEQGIGRSLERFATNCGLDANALTDWQELCKVQGCQVQ